MTDQIKPPEPFKLSPSDKDSLTWARLKKHLQARQEVLRNELENDLDPVETAKRRGHLREIKGLLALDKPNPAPGS